MKTTTLRQRNYRHRLDLEICIGHFIAAIKRNRPPQTPVEFKFFTKNFDELELCIKEYIKLNKNKKKEIS